MISVSTNELRKIDAILNKSHILPYSPDMSTYVWMIENYPPKPHIPFR